MRAKGNRKRRPILLLLPWLAVAIGGLREAGAHPERPHTAARELRVAAASDLKFAFDTILRDFEQLHPEIKVRVTYGSSGNFYSQILNQAPFDIYFSADLTYPRKLSEQGLTLKGSDFVYGVGRLVLWAPNASSVDVRRLGIAALRNGSIRHIAIANPRHAPYGRAAEAALRSMGLYEELRDKLVYGENVAQALQFAQSGAAEIGIIAHSLVVSPGVKDQGSYVEIPTGKYPAMEQGGIITKWARDPAAAWELRSFILGAKGRAILSRFGFSSPGE